MRKFAFGLCLIAVAVFFAGCAAFDDFKTAYADEDENYEAVVFIEYGQSMSVHKFLELRGQIEFTGTVNVNGVDVVITKSELRTDEAGDGFMPLYLTLTNVPPRKIETKTTLFYKEQTTTAFNPISVLPAGIAGIDYLYGIQTDQRVTYTDTPYMIQENGVYVYVWKTRGDLIIVDRLANTPIYYVIAILITGITAAIVYFTCKSKYKTI
jgi:hypothetical protein